MRTEYPAQTGELMWEHIKQHVHFAKKLKEYCDAVEEFSREAKEQLGFVTLAKGGNEKGKVQRGNTWQR